MAKFLKYWLPPILWAGFIFYLSGIAGLNSGMPVFYDVFWRKLAHAAEFGIFNLLLFRAFRGQEFNFKKALVWSFFLSVIYAFSDELHQYFVPDRECRWQDAGIDSLGVLLTSMCIYFILLIIKKRDQDSLMEK